VLAQAERGEWSWAAGEQVRARRRLVSRSRAAAWCGRLGRSSAAAWRPARGSKLRQGLAHGLSQQGATGGEVGAGGGSKQGVAGGESKQGGGAMRAGCGVDQVMGRL
jgi:hypothetical protein